MPGMRIPTSRSEELAATRQLQPSFDVPKRCDILISLVGSADSHSPLEESDGKPSDSASPSSTAKPSSKSTGPTSRSTPIFESIADTRARQMSLPAVSPAPTLAMQATALASTDPTADYG